MSEPDPLHPVPHDIRPGEFQEIDFSQDDRSLLSCPKCNHFISGADINIEKTIAKCHHCGHLFGFAHDSLSGRIKPQAIMPEGVEALKLRSELDLQLSWKKTTAGGGRKFIALFAFLWNMIVFPFVFGALISGNWGLMLFLSLHFLVGVSLIWWLAATQFNKTSIQLSDRRMRIRTFPIKVPLFKNREIDLDQIDQLYVSEYVASRTNGNPNYAYALYAILKDGEKVSLLRGMTKEAQRFMEQEIEGFLGIQNRKISGEV